MSPAAQAPGPSAYAAPGTEAGSAANAAAGSALPDHRQRVLEAMAALVQQQPLAHITIADVVAQARVSKRTFYEQFASKEACFLALCEQMSEQTLAVIAANYRVEPDWVVQLENVTRVYLASLSAQPALLKAMSLELLALGNEGLALRRRISNRFAQFLIMQVELFRLVEPNKRPMSPALATALVGGVNELILQAAEEGRADRLADMTPQITEFMVAVIRSLDPANDAASGSTSAPVTPA
jgi:AcrR family transcriptional regulator